ncbi:MAG: hypothetical protein SFU56_02825 [Capsulimonadales bacterium]|nr:hypothetical protein [Capsulimonadales bacterium]
MTHTSMARSVSVVRRVCSVALALFAIVPGIGCGGSGGGSPRSGSSGAQIPTPAATSTPTPSPVTTGDYYNSRYPRWTRLPIRVRFDRASGITPEIESRLRQGMDAWKDGTGGRLTYRVTEDADADVEVTFREVGNTLHGVTEGSWYEDGAIVDMTIRLSEQAKTVSPLMQARIMAHEWGHALGLIDNQPPHGHSDVAADRMSPVLNPNEPAANGLLTARDINTIRRLYGF